MGALSDFLRGAAGEVYNQSAQRRQMRDQLEMEDQRTKRQLRFAEAAEARRRRAQNEDRAAELNMQGPQVGVDDAGRPALIRAQAEVDPASGALRARRERVADAPVTPVGRPFTVYDGQSRRSVQRYSDGTEKDLGDPSPIREANSSGAPRDAEGLTPYQRKQLELARNREQRLRDGSGKGGERPDNVRKAWDEEAARISAMEGEALRSKAIQYGMDQRGLPTDDDTLRAALLAQVESEYGKRLKSASSRGSEPAKPASEKKEPQVSYADAAAEVKRRRPDLSEDDVRAYLATKGIRP